LSCRNKIKNDFFDAEYTKIISRWALDYYDKTKEPIASNIVDIYERESTGLKYTDAELIDEFLISLSKEFESQGNETYLDTIFNSLFKKKELKSIIDEASFYYRSGDIDKAYACLRKRNQIEKQTKKSFDPFTKKEIVKFFAKDEDDRLEIFSDPTMREFFRYLKPTWFISFAAKEKLGKSYFLEELVFCCIEAGYNVLLLSVELNEELMKERIYTRISQKGKDYEENILSPIMDCKNNQYNSCTSKHRSCNVGCMDDAGVKKEFDMAVGYKACVFCRGKNGNDFQAAVWHQKITIEKMTVSDVIESAQTYKKIYGDRIRVYCPDAFSATLEDTEAHLDYLAEVENFYPKFLICDYLDIIDTDGKETGREKINKLWIRMKQLLQKKNLCGITVEQTSKEGSRQVSQDATHVSEEKRKNSHVDAKYGLNSSEIEAKDGCVRINAIFHRHFKIPHKQLLCLRQLEISSPVIDSELITVAETQTQRHSYK
jgi:hypothetical protein